MRLVGFDLATAFTDFLSSRVRTCTPGAVGAYRKNLSGLIAFCAAQGAPGVEDVTTAVLERFIDDLRTRERGQGRGGRLSRVTIKKRATAVRTFFAWVKETGLRDDDPSRKMHMPKVGKQLPKALTLDEERRLLDLQMSSRERAILYLLLDSGLRLSEAAALTWRDLDLNAGTVHVQHGKGDKSRVAVFATETTQALRALHRERPLAQPDDRVFTGQQGALTPSGLYRVIKRLAQRAGIPLHPHSLRHTFARDYLNNGGSLADLSELLGHTDLATTAIYLSVARESLSRKHAQFSPVNRVYAEIGEEHGGSGAAKILRLPLERLHRPPDEPAAASDQAMVAMAPADPAASAPALPPEQAELPRAAPDQAGSAGSPEPAEPLFRVNKGEIRNAPREGQKPPATPVLKDGSPEPAEPLPEAFTQALADFLRDRLLTCAPSTVETYGAQLTAFLAFCAVEQGRTEIEEVGFHEIDLYLESLRARSSSPVTPTNRRFLLRSFLRFLHPATPECRLVLELSEALELHLAELRLRRRNQTAVWVEQSVLGAFLEAMGARGVQELGAVTPVDVSAFIDTLRARGLTANTIYDYHVKVRCFFLWCQAQGLRRDNPAEGLEFPEAELVNLQRRVRRQQRRTPAPRTNV
jgi:site-specific recombinase XerD